MNKPVRLTSLEPSHVGAARMPARRDVILLGMPQLALAGVSESWLLKECGHRHWLLLAEAAGLAVPDFRDDRGEPIYAAFVAVSIRNAALGAAREHDELTFSSRLARSSGTQCTSIHQAHIGARRIGEVAMTSSFVKRAPNGGNHCVARVKVPALRSFGPDPLAQSFAAESLALRSGRWIAHLGLEREHGTVINRLVIDPCPSQDFNGAEFLYFTSFQAFIDRAEWAFFRPKTPLSTTHRRDIVYRGNVDPGERVVATLLAFRQQDRRLAHWYRLSRESDAKLLADVFTVRERVSRR